MGDAYSAPINQEKNTFNYTISELAYTSHIPMRRPLSMISDAYMAPTNQKQRQPEMRCRQRHLPLCHVLTKIYHPHCYGEAPYQGF